MEMINKNTGNVHILETVKQVVYDMRYGRGVVTLFNGQQFETTVSGIAAGWYYDGRMFYQGLDDFVEPTFPVWILNDVAHAHDPGPGKGLEAGAELIRDNRVVVLDKVYPINWEKPKTPYNIIHGIIEDQCSFVGRNDVHDFGEDILVTSNRIDIVEMKEIAHDIIKALPDTWEWAGTSETAILFSKGRDEKEIRKSV